MDGERERRGRHADRDDERHEQLRDGDADVAARRVEAEREALVALGKKNEMFAIEEEKLPPPTPAVAAQASSTRNCVSWASPASQPLGRRNASNIVGISSSPTVTVVQARPPSLGTANV